MTEHSLHNPDRQAVAARQRLANLVDAYAEAKEQEQAAADRAKDLRDQLLTANQELLMVDAEDPDVLVGSCSVVRISLTSTWRLDTARLKREQAETYAAYAVQTSSTRLTVSAR